MAIKVKQAKDLSTNEVIYFKGHAQATYLSDGTTVEDAINNIESGSGSSVDLSNYYTKIEIDGKGYVTSTQLEAKQDVISDIDTIRTNASNYKGTITGVSANGTSVATNGVANIPAASTSKYGVTKLTSATNSTSTVLAATASAVKAAYDLADGKQAALVSGTNIKTINGESILGSGNIESLASKEYVDEKSDSKVFIGTLAEYQSAYAAGKIAVGALVIIMEEGEDANDTIALLGTAVLGKMILGQK